MEVMESTTDGFRIAEEDLALRGPGEFFGTRQSGMPAFKIADFIRDVGIMEVALREAQRIVAADPELTLPEHRAIGKIVAEKYRRRLLETVA
jgi:ATP-dependent DNA helicase RecG